MAHGYAARRVTVAMALAFTLGADLAAAPPSGPQPRPRMGLALGGGSARGLAHIGVLQWLDEHRIPVDAVAGTSMGGLIGGMFATGMTTDEIRDFMASMDWARVLAPDSPFGDKTFRRKEDARAFPSVLEFGLKDGFRLPSGLNPAEQVNLQFDRIALPYYAVRDFSALPVPFKCVAADLRASEVVVLESGRLAEALRATMAIPGVFPPVRLDNRTLVDGGILNNVPADVVRSMGADIVIAVDVSGDVNTPKTSDTIFAVLGEMLDVMMRAAMRPTLAGANIVLTPDLRTLTLTDFGRYAEFARHGYVAAEANRDRLLTYAVSEADYQAHLEARRARRRTMVPIPAFLQVDGVKGAQALVIRRQLRRHVGRPVDTAALERDLTLLTGSERYDTITYHLEEENGRAGLIVTAREKIHAPPYLLAAVDLQSSESSTISAAVRGRLTFFDVLTPGSEARLDGSVGQVTGIGAEWVVALGSRGFFVAPRVSVSRAYVNLFADEALVSEYRLIRRNAGFDAGYTTGRSLELRVGYDYERIDGRSRIGESVLPEVSGAQPHWRARLVFDGQDSAVLPRRGLYLRSEARRYTGAVRLSQEPGAHQYADPDDLTQAEVTGSAFVRAGHRGSVFVAGGAGSSFGDTATINAFTMGGPLALSSLQRDEQRGSHYLLAAAGYFHRVARFLEGAVGQVYVGGWAEHGGVFEKLDRLQPTTNFSAGAIVETVIGPAFVMGSVGVDGRYRFNVGLGPVFRR